MFLIQFHFPPQSWCAGYILLGMLHLIFQFQSFVYISRYLTFYSQLVGSLLWSLRYSCCSTSFEAWEENIWGAHWIKRIRFYKGWPLHLWATIWAKYNSKNCKHAHWYHWESMWTSWRRYFQQSLPLTLTIFFTFLYFKFVTLWLQLDWICFLSKFY